MGAAEIVGCVRSGGFSVAVVRVSGWVPPRTGRWVGWVLGGCGAGFRMGAAEIVGVPLRWWAGVRHSEMARA